jgi:hypothetical protein
MAGSSNKPFGIKEIDLLPLGYLTSNIKPGVGKSGQPNITLK